MSSAGRRAAAARGSARNASSRAVTITRGESGGDGARGARGDRVAYGLGQLANGHGFEQDRTDSEGSPLGFVHHEVAAEEERRHVVVAGADQREELAAGEPRHLLVEQKRVVGSLA